MLTLAVARRMKERHGKYARLHVAVRLNRYWHLDAEGRRCVYAEDAGKWLLWSRVSHHLLRGNDDQNEAPEGR